MRADSFGKLELHSNGILSAVNQHKPYEIGILGADTIIFLSVVILLRICYICVAILLLDLFNQQCVDNQTRNQQYVGNQV